MKTLFKISLVLLCVAFAGCSASTSNPQVLDERDYRWNSMFKIIIDAEREEPFQVFMKVLETHPQWNTPDKRRENKTWKELYEQGKMFIGMSTLMAGNTSSGFAKTLANADATSKAMSGRCAKIETSNTKILKANGEKVYTSIESKSSQIADGRILGSGSIYSRPIFQKDSEGKSTYRTFSLVDVPFILCPRGFLPICESPTGCPLKGYEKQFDKQMKAFFGMD